MIKFHCSSCSKKLGVPDEYAGRRVRCPQCNNPSIVPEPEAVGIDALLEVPLEPEAATQASSRNPVQIDLEQIPENPNSEVLQEFRRQQRSERQVVNSSKPADSSTTFERFGPLSFILNPIIHAIGSFPLAVITSVVVAALAIVIWSLIAVAVDMPLEVFYVVVAVAAGIGLCVISDQRGTMMGMLSLFMGLMAMVAGRMTQVHLFVLPQWHRIATSAEIPPDREKLYLVMKQLGGKRGNDAFRREIAEQDTEMPTIAICTLIQDGKLDTELGLDLHFEAKAQMEQGGMSLETAAREMTFYLPELTEAWSKVAKLLQEWDTPEKRFKAVKGVYMRYMFFNEQTHYKLLLDDYARAMSAGFFMCEGGCTFLFLRVLYWIVGLIGAYKTCSESFMD